MDNFIPEFFDFPSNPFLEADQIAPSPADTSIAQANGCASLPFHDGGLPAYSDELQHTPQTGTNSISQQQVAITLPFESMNNYRQPEVFSFASNSGVQQPNFASTSGGSLVPFDGLFGGMPTWNQLNGAADVGVPFNNYLNPQTTAEYDARGYLNHYLQDAMASGSNQLPPNDPSFFQRFNPSLQQPTLNATHDLPFHDLQNLGLSFISYQSYPMAQPFTLDAPQQQAHGYQQTTGVPDEPFQQDKLMGQQSLASYLNDAVYALPEQMQRLATRSPIAEGELASLARDATENRTLPDRFSPSCHSDAGALQPTFNEHKAIDFQPSPKVPPLAYQPQVDMGERPALSNHSDATNALLEPVHRSMTESPLTDEPITPPGHNAPLNGLVRIPGEVKEQNHELVSPAMQMPVPLYPQGVFSPMANSPAAPSPVDPWVSEQAGHVNLQGYSPQAAEVHAPQPVFAETLFTFRYAIPPSEGRSSVSFTSASTSPAQKPIRFEFYKGPNPAGAGSSRKHQDEHEHEESRPAKRVCRTWSARNSPSSRLEEAHAQSSGELFPLFAPLASNDAILGYASAPGQVGASTSYTLHEDMTLYDIFVAMRGENDRNRAAGVGNANGNGLFTWDKWDMERFDFLCRSSRH